MIRLVITFTLSLLCFIAFGQNDLADAIAKEKEAYFVNRPTSAGTDVGTDKKNVPVKKESFTAKIARYKDQGFKVAVVLSSGLIVSERPSPTATSSASVTIPLQGYFSSERESLNPLADDLVNKMNDAFSTDIFEVVDLSSIPVKDGKLGQVDDWASTKYKMVMTLGATPVYSYTSFSSEFSGKMYVNLNVVATEYVNDPKKGVKMKYPIRAGNLGAYSTNIKKWESDPELKQLTELKDILNPPSGKDLLSACKAEFDKSIEGFIAKRKK